MGVKFAGNLRKSERMGNAKAQRRKERKGFVS